MLFFVSKLRIAFFFISKLRITFFLFQNSGLLERNVLDIQALICNDFFVTLVSCLHIKLGERLGRLEAEKQKAVEEEDFDMAKLKKVDFACCVVFVSTLHLLHLTSDKGIQSGKINNWLLSLMAINLVTAHRKASNVVEGKTFSGFLY